MFPIQFEELTINHLTLLLVVTMPYACWFLWRANYTEDFKWRLHFQFGVAFWRVFLREVYFEGPNRVWRALKTSILNTAAPAGKLLCRRKVMKLLSHLAKRFQPTSTSNWGWFHQISDWGDFGHNNRLRSLCLQVQPVTCWHPPVFLYWIGV